MIKSPSGRMPEMATRWDLTGREGCGGGKVFSWMPMLVGDIWEYIGERIMSGSARGANKGGGAPYPLGVPSILVAASWLLRLHLQVSWLPSGPRNIIAKVLLCLDSVWYSFSVKLKNREKQELALGSRLIG